MRVLCVAEKPSISKAITQILSGGQFETSNTASNFIKNYNFNYPQTNSIFTVTSVAGHLTANDFYETHRKWNSCDAFDLFDAAVETVVPPDKKAIETNLLNQARQANVLMIWTDCDREGEHIGMEIARVCRRSNANIRVKRARFSAIIAQQIHNAAQNPVELDRRQADAVEARILLDLKVGAAFTRLQTLILQGRVPQIEKSVVSYGPCQFPTLGFVVHRYRMVKTFQPESFWYIYLSLTRQTTSEGNEETKFNWKRNHLFDQAVVLNLFVRMGNSLAVVTKVTNKTTKKWKPLPLTTVELQKAGSRLLHLAPKKVLDIAEKLYQQGFVSYPRTETDEFDPQFDHMALIQKQTADPVWGTFATSLQEGGYNSPRKGKNNDKAHPPIHPTAHANNLVGEEKKVYEYITRRYLACCSKDAEGWQTTVDVVCGGEEFCATGLVVKERNYLNVYIYDKWTGHTVPDFQEGEEFQPTLCEVRQGETSRPNYLTEADLVTLMDKNGIGTDATIAQHIQTIIDRDYVIERMEGATKYLVPSTLGIGLIEGYNEIGLAKNVSKPQLRRETERRMVQVCQGTVSKADMLTQGLNQYKEMFIIVRREFERVTNSVSRYLSGQGDAQNAQGGAGPGPGGGGGGNGGRGGGGDDDDNAGGGGGGGRGGTGRGAGTGTTRGTRGRGAASARARGAAGRGRGRGVPGTASVISVLDSDDDDVKPAKPPPRASRTAAAVARALDADSVAEAAPTQRRTAPLHVTADWQAAPVVRKPTAAVQYDSGGAGDFQCGCNVPAVQRTVVQDSASKGRKFWTCPTRTCGFFQWVEDGAVASGSGSSSAVQKPPARPQRTADSASGNDDIQCGCNVAAAQRTVVQETASKGKKFWTCPTRTCGFFQWFEDAPIASSSRAVSNSVPSKRPYSATQQDPSVVPRKCRCNEDANMNTTFKEGPNQGRKFWKCRNSDAGCGFFEWDDEPPRDGGTSFSQGSNGGASRTGSLNTASNSMKCFKCDQEGHFSNACPNGDTSSNKRSRSFGNNANDAVSSATCFKCQQPGHYSSSCPNGDDYKSKRGNAGGSDDCFKCGKKGHWSSNCPSDRGPSNVGAKRSYSSGSASAKRGRGGGSTRGKRGRGGKKSKFGAADDY